MAWSAPRYENDDHVRKGISGFLRGAIFALLADMMWQEKRATGTAFMNNLIRVKVHAPSGTIILQRPEKRNALSRLMMVQIRQALEDLHQERQVRAIILTGAGTAFCAGLDLAEIHATLGTDDVLQQWHRDTLQLKELLEMMLEFPKPIIAAVNGPAIGAGAGLVLASDIVLGTPDAQFGLPEPRYGLVSGIAAPLLAFRAGGSCGPRSVDGRSTVCRRALHRGIYQQLVPFDQAWAAAHERAAQCAAIRSGGHAAHQAHAERDDR